MKKSQIVLYIFSFLILAIICVSVFNSQKAYDENQLESIEENIRKAVITCYSIEGYYPSDINYLKDNYGLVIDESKVNVFYQAIASNIFPDIMVSRK